MEAITANALIIRWRLYLRYLSSSAPCKNDPIRPHRIYDTPKMDTSSELRPYLSVYCPTTLPSVRKFEKAAQYVNSSNTKLQFFTIFGRLSRIGIDWILEEELGGVGGVLRLRMIAGKVSRVTIIALMS